MSDHTAQPRIAAIKGEILGHVMHGMSIRPLPTQQGLIVRSAAISRMNAEAVRDEALMSGALPGEFEVVHIYRRGCGWAGMEARLR